MRSDPHSGAPLLAVRERVACLETPALPLQLLLAQQPDWRELPVVVVEEERPQGLVTWVNDRARAHGILPGQTYATALGLARKVRGRAVPPAALGAGVARVIAALRQFTPRIEPSDDEPGIFWFDASGMVGLWPDLETWARAVLGAITAMGFEAVMAVGFSRFGAYAAAKSLAVKKSQGATEALIFPAQSDERALTERVPLAYLAVPPLARERLDRLGVHTLGELVLLPPAGILKRYGPEAHRLHRLARGDLMMPLEPQAEVIPVRGQALLDFLEHDAHSLLFRTKTLLDLLLPIIVERQTAVAELLLDLGFEDARDRERTIYMREVIRPAKPTGDGALLIDLVRLRLENVDIRRGVVEIRLELIETSALLEQTRLFRGGLRRDNAAAARALARVQAELGDGAVVRGVVRDGHLPRTQQELEPFTGALPEPQPQPPAHGTPMLVRRLAAKAETMLPRPRDLRNDGWPTVDQTSGPIHRILGPFIISGGWWLRRGDEVHREYYLADTTKGAILWIYYNCKLRRWFKEGWIQ